MTTNDFSANQVTDDATAGIGMLLGEGEVGKVNASLKGLN